MLRRSLLVATLALLAPAGCKQPAKESFATQAAAAQLAASSFAVPNAVQTLTFRSGGAREPQPAPFDGFLYAKHWLVCAPTQPGPFSRTEVCRFDAVGRTYAHANGWTSSSAPDCARCETWTVPLARARLTSVSAVTLVDPSHATAAYTYEVLPNEIGAQLAVWMRANPVAWCGPDPRAIGDWSHERTGSAAFVRTGDAWVLARAPEGFAATFSSPVQRPARPCLPAT